VIPQSIASSHKAPVVELELELQLVFMTSDIMMGRPKKGWKTV